MQIDIRNYCGDQVKEILFWNADWADAHKVVLDSSDTKIADGDAFVYIRSEEHARYLIKALEKAIDLGTWS